ncbi:MAG TPA: alpha/beta hydrolase [Archangium sp.]|uniref:alpha/beta fold hydrolase n=1 Tax=Archangium sp. TaxID=1872627 RepID=UPI002E381795|nr:alpha/beta hydrolase [Archangium sp.]HEX5751565.1 alpha/beta hydrolase [Archangium sp.]
MVLKQRGLVKTPYGLIHYVAVGTPRPDRAALVCLHMSPRSVDEFRELQELLGSEERRVVAIDELGYGASDNPDRSVTLEQLADAVMCVVEHLGIQRFCMVGSLMGCYMGINLAARFPERCAGLFLHNPYLWPDEAVEKARSQAASENPSWAAWESKPDGSHFTDIWKLRSAFLPPDINTRCVVDDAVYRLKRNLRQPLNIHIQEPQLFDFTRFSHQVKCSVLCVFGEQCVTFFDAIGYRMTEQKARLAEKFPGAASYTEHHLPAASINMLNTHATDIARILTDTLSTLGV